MSWLLIGNEVTIDQSIMIQRPEKVCALHGDWTCHLYKRWELRGVEFNTSVAFKFLNFAAPRTQIPRAANRFVILTSYIYVIQDQKIATVNIQTHSGQRSIYTRYVTVFSPAHYSFMGRVINPITLLFSGKKN